MRPDALTRRAMLQMTTGGVIAAPLALTDADTAAQGLAPVDAGSHPGPARRLEGVISVVDESAIPSPHRAGSAAKVTIAIAADGRGVLTIGYFGEETARTIALPASVARDLDHALFGVETARDRDVREKREAGWIDCPMCDASRYPCRAGLCDEGHLVHPDTITRHLGPWFTAQDVAAELRRVPAAWGAVVDSYGYWYGTVTERLRGTSEDGRVESVILQLHGLGWGAGDTPEGDVPDGPVIDLWPTHGTHHHPIDPDYPVEWCAYLPGDPVHGACDTIGDALDRAVASIAGRLATVESVAIERALDGLALAA